VCCVLISFLVLFEMGEELEKLFSRQHNQLGDYEQCLVDQHKKDIVSRITHVIDCEAYTVSKERIYLRKFPCTECVTM
jgi:hypothetical protein